jgi:hypothetical protein
MLCHVRCHLTRGGNAYLGRCKQLWGQSGVRRRLPGPERDEKAHPREEEDSSIFVDDIENGNRPGFLVVWVEFWCGPELVDCEAHVENLGRCAASRIAERQGYLADLEIEER